MSQIHAHQISELLSAESELDRATYYHVGILVSDLDQAVRTYGERLGLTFAGPQSVHVPRFEEAGRDGPIDVRVAFSRQGPPYWELLEKTGRGFYGTEQPDGLNHVGIYVDDIDEAIREVERSGLESEAVQYDEDGSVLVAFFQPSGLHGVRLELVPEGRRDRFESWLRGDGVYPGLPVNVPAQTTPPGQ
jgi:catechol 2,3-dioxygenase-like lactoylglutathione lyase family enzyme